MCLHSSDSKEKIFISRLRVLFLDVDGVLNHKAFLEGKSSGSWPLDHLDEKAILLLNYIVEKTDCRIVITSTWRSTLQWPVLAQVLTQRGFKWESNVIGQTPRASFDNRGMEIAAWLAEHKEVTSFVILDDDEDMAHLHSHLVRTDWYVGLTPEIAEKVISCLTSPQVCPNVGHEKTLSFRTVPYSKTQEGISGSSL